MDNTPSKILVRFSARKRGFHLGRGNYESLPGTVIGFGECLGQFPAVIGEVLFDKLDEGASRLAHQFPRLVTRNAINADQFPHERHGGSPLL
jgi:hypothetical protein